MTSNRQAGLALIVGAAVSLVTMSLHPTGTEVLANAKLGVGNLMDTAVHAIGIAAQPLLVLGSLGLITRLSSQKELAIVAAIVTGFSAIAMTIAAVASGLIAPATLAAAAGATPAQLERMTEAFRYTAVVNQAFAKVGLVGWCVAITCWALAMRNESASWGILPWYGLIIAFLSATGLASGHLVLNVHGFGAVVLAYGVFWSWTGVRLLRRNPLQDTTGLR